MKSFNPLVPLQLLLMLLIIGCKQDSIKPISDGGAAPGPVKNAHVQNTAGGAIISFTLPDASDLLYIKAEYDLHGTKMEARTSFYKNNLEVEGYGDTSEHSVTLYAVSRSEKVSSPV